MQSGVIAKKWAALTEEQRAKWNADQKAAKVQHEAVHGKPAKKVKTAKAVKAGAGEAKPKKDKSGPKHPKSAYIYFSMEKGEAMRKENPTLKMTDTSKVVSEMWKALSAEAKKPFEDKAAADKARYTREKGGAAPAGGAAGGAGAGGGEEADDDDDEDDDAE
jgi:structure-specific recognition protein 1